MSEPISTLAAGAFIPHGYCYLWERGLVWLHVVSDTLIAASYFSLPAALAYFVYKRRDIAFKSLFVMFGVFILACGLTHVMGVWTIWVPAYWLDGGVKAATALVSLATAVMIWPLIPKALALPSPAQLQTANRELQREVAVRTATEHALRESDERYRVLNEALEANVQERTKQLRDAQEELVRKGKLAMLGQVAGSVGHELRNPLGVMTNAVYFLKTVLTNADVTTKEYLDIIGDEVAGAERIVSDLLDSVRTKPPQPQRVGVADLIRHTVKRCTIPEHVEVIANLPDGMPPLTVDPQQMQQVFRNLIQNGLDAMPSNGRLTITATEDTAAGTVRVSVRDTGCGIRPEQMAKLFQPLFTTKARGIGLGLVVVKNLTEANRGKVEVQSQAGEGTVFTVVLPAAPEDGVAITQTAGSRAA
jgi:signal transduction histidine kinase